ncbi:MAG: bifunctional 4-hydroxy-2-oxoglutarate aldolase/2-dehydro-3-deoxy-phosphogluconate aldolase [Ruminococcaceae bacterium]|jgi:2-dehydro-3-deoxyphosphogluconate aldolase/(4S)-4-hydroxy-2-oxoglutarate aldolase|nr:bifunctional 4-hydroxy-2-oxoglutarate aldolase/2-dehydro-3-deoxy-phosphogluconate aldolase [Oscillospiraceae bacterium]
MNEVLKTISRIGIVPVIAIEDAAKAVPLAKALVAGGLPAAEVTFRTAAAEDAMKAIVAEVPEMLVGAGTVTTHDQLDRALAAGAQFIVSPGFNPDTVKYGLSKGALMLPGTATGGEMEQAMALGLEAVKFFPAEDNGGVKKLKAFAGPYRKLMWMPTGGVNTKNLMDYLSFDQILACGGTWMVKKDLIEGERWDEITAICKEAVRTMLGVRLAHVGVNCGDAEEAKRLAGMIGAMLGLAPRETSKSWFAGDAIEYMSGVGPGTKGHIGFKTNSVERAMYHLGRQGVEFDPESIQYNDKGAAKFVYIKGEFGGFAIHLVQ